MKSIAYVLKKQSCNTQKTFWNKLLRDFLHWTNSERFYEKVFWLTSGVISKKTSEKIPMQTMSYIKQNWSVTCFFFWSFSTYTTARNWKMIRERVFIDGKFNFVSVTAVVSIYCETRSVHSSDKFNRLNNSIRRKSINHYTRLFQLYPNMTWLRTFFIRFPVPASSVPHQSHKRRNKFVLISSSKTSGLSMFSVCARSKHVPIPASPEHADNTRFLPTFGQETRCFALKATLFLFTRF